LTIAFFDISGGEIFVILLVVFIIFGPDKIPEIARWIGKTVNEVKRATSEITDEISKETKDIREAADKLKEDIHKTTREITKTVEDTGKDHKNKEPQL
jgi:Tat protein translocase TatB subunit